LLPTFLIIGSMKSATTSLFRDLGANPAIFVPEDKEPDALTTDAIFTTRGRQAYSALFAGCRPDQMAGEASTSYTKRDDHPGVPERAKRILGSGLKLIYSVRDPVDRIVSHHHHDYAYGFASGDIDFEVRNSPRYLEVSRYMWQATAWLQHFSRDQLQVVRFEDYTNNRPDTVDSVSRFLGVRQGGHLVEADRTFNPSGARHSALGPWRAIAQSEIYRRGPRRLMSWRLRARLRAWILPKGAPRPRAPSPETLRWLEDELAEDVFAFSRLATGKDKSMWARWTQKRFVA